MVERKICSNCFEARPIECFAFKGPARPGGARRIAAVCKRCFNAKQAEGRAEARRRRLEKRCPVCGNTQLPTHTRGPLLYELRAQRESKKLLAIAIELHELYLLDTINHPLFRSIAQRNERCLASVCGRRWVKRKREVTEKGKR